MAFPWIFASNFEQGTNAEWDSESDTGARLDFPHYSALAAVPGMPAPWSGAFCMRIVMGDTNDHTLIEGDIDVADTVTRYSSFMLYIGADVDATANDTWAIYEVQGTANAIENSIGFRYTAATDVLDIGVGNVAPTAFYTINKGFWYHVELVSVIQTGGTGTATLWIDGASVASVTTLTNTAVLRGVLGTQDTLSTTSGTLLFKDFKFDDAQIYPPSIRFPTSPLLTKSAHVFVGPGRINSARLLSGAATDNVLSIYDTDVGSTLDASKVVLELKNTANSQLVASQNKRPVHIRRGCYVDLSGTNPRAQIDFGATAYGSDGAIRTYAMKRVATPGNV